MKTYVKIEGENVEPIVQKLAKLAVNLPEICAWDLNMLDMGWGYPDDSPSAANVGEMATYLGMEQGAFEKNCDNIVSKTPTDLGDANIYFEWQTPPSNEQLAKLRGMIDGILKPYGNKYKVTNKN